MFQSLASSISGALTTAVAAASSSMTTGASTTVANDRSQEPIGNYSKKNKNKKNNKKKSNHHQQQQHHHNKHRQPTTTTKKKKKSKSLPPSTASSGINVTPPVVEHEDGGDQEKNEEGNEMNDVDVASEASSSGEPTDDDDDDDDDEGLAKILPPAIRSSLLRNNNKNNKNKTNKNTTMTNKTIDNNYSSSTPRHCGGHVAPASTAGTAPTDVTPSQDQLQQSLMSDHGLSTQEVNTATEHIWNKNVPYKRPNAKLNYMDGRFHDLDLSPCQNNSKSPTTTTTMATTTTTTTTTTTISSSSSLTEEEQQNQSVTSVTYPSSVYFDGDDDDDDDEEEQQSEKAEAADGTGEHHSSAQDDDDNQHGVTIRKSNVICSSLDLNDRKEKDEEEEEGGGEEEDSKGDCSNMSPHQSTTGMKAFDSHVDLATTTTTTVEATFDAETTIPSPPSSPSSRNQTLRGGQQQRTHHPRLVDKDRSDVADQGQDCRRHATMAQNGGGATPASTTDIVDGDDRFSNTVRTGCDVHHGNAMAQKLDIVAGFDKLTDAIYALTEWINKAAKPIELNEFCKAKVTTALPTVLRRAIVECIDETKDDTVVLSSLLRMLSCLLSRCDIDCGTVEELENNLEGVLTEARAVYTFHSGNNDESHGIPDRVAHFVTSLVSNVVSKSQVTTIEAYHPSKRTDIVSTFMWKREMQKVEAKRAGSSAQTALKALLGALVGGDMKQSPGGPTRRVDLDLSHDDAVLVLVGEKVKASFEVQKRILENLQNETRHDGDDGGDDNTTSEELHSLENERISVRDKIAKLEAALAVLECQDEVLSRQIGDLKGSILKVRLMKAERNRKMNEQLDQAKTTVQYGESIDRLASTMMTFSKSMNMALNVSNMPNEIGMSASGLMTVYLQHARNYFLSEAECIEQLRRRLNSNETELTDLENELAGCNGEMDWNYIEVEESISIVRTKIEADAKRAASFKEEASELFENLMSQLEEYKVAVSAKNIGLERIQTDILSGVPSSLKTLGLTSAAIRLESFLSSMNHPQNIQDHVARSNSNVVAVLTGSSLTTSDPSTLPTKCEKAQLHSNSKGSQRIRLSWCDNATTAAVKSLLDIQREEMQSK